MTDTKPGAMLQGMRNAQEFLLRKPGLLPVAMIIIASCAVYFNALFNGFVSDDVAQIVENPWIRDVRYIPEIFTKSVWDFEGLVSNYYRPLMHIIYMTNYYLFRLESWGYHAVNVLFHAGVSLLVFLITSMILKRSRPEASPPLLTPPFIAAVLFATHPIHTEAVTWLAAIPELSFTFFYLLSLYLYIRTLPEISGSSSRGGLFLSCGSFFLASLCKETALTLPVILLAYDYAFQKKPFMSRPVDALKRYAPFFLVAGAYLLLRLHSLGAFAPVSRPDSNTQQFLINAFPLFVQYLGKILVPIHLTAEHAFHPATSILDHKSIVSLALSLLFLSFLLIAARKDKAVFFGLVLIAVPLLPVLYVPALAGSPFGERYLYLPSVGFVLLLAFCIDRIAAHKKKGLSVAAALALLGVLSLYSYGTVSRNAVWKDDYTLWTDAVKKSPDSPRAHVNAGRALSLSGRRDEAREHFRTALRLKPDLAEDYMKQGIALSQRGLMNLSLYAFDVARVLDPGNAEVRYNLGLAFTDKGWLDLAVEQYQLAIQLRPGYADAHNNLGVVYAKKEMMDKAIEHFQAALRLDPRDPSYHQNIAHAYEIQGRHEKAEEHRREAGRLEHR